MPFAKGYDPNRARGGRRNPPGGRPTKEHQEAKKLAAELARSYLEKHLKPVLDTYLASAIGKKIGAAKCKIDPATTRHYVDRFVPPARASTMNLGKSIEDILEEIECDEAELGSDSGPKPDK